MKIAIQKDLIIQRNGERQSFSARWLQRAAEQGIDAYTVNVRAHDLMRTLRGADGFMWRFGYPSYPRLLAKRLLPAIEQGMGIPVFPSWKTAWSFEDKIAQAYQLDAAAIPAARTWIFWKKDEALCFCKDYAYPAVTKLYYGFQSRNVTLLSSYDQARAWIERLFDQGLTGFTRQVNLARGELHRGYFYLQEFLPQNAFDTRITVIGDRAFGFRRMNRPDDFRASGSGLIDWDPAGIDMRFVELAYRVADAFGTQSVAIDGLYANGVPIVNEISYTYASWAIRECPGHWRREQDGALRWVQGPVLAEDAIFDDFVAQVAVSMAKRRETPAGAAGSMVL